MAVDKTEPPIKVIIGFAVLSIGILIVLRVLLVSYFNNAYGTRQHGHMDQVLGHGGWNFTASQVREAEQSHLGGLRPAMEAIARGDRPAAIAPHASNDVAALQGWAQAPRQVPRTAPAPAPVVAPAAAPAPAAGAPVANAPAAPAAVVMPAAPGAPVLLPTATAPAGAH